jgi:hypothetical protein
MSWARVSARSLSFEIGTGVAGMGDLAGWSALAGAQPTRKSNKEARTVERVVGMLVSLLAS